jgi:hypothetical protein
VAGAVYHALVGVDGYGLRVRDLAERLRRNAGSASRVLARVAVREREKSESHEQRLALEEHVARLMHPPLGNSPEFGSQHVGQRCTKGTCRSWRPVVATKAENVEQDMSMYVYEGTQAKFIWEFRITSPLLTRLPRGEHCMRISRLSSTRPVLISICFLSWTFLSARAQQGAGHPVARQESRSPENQTPEGKRPGQPRPSTDDSVPSGLVVVIADKPQQNRLDLTALNNPFISGVALQIHWRDIEPAQGKPDWSKLDELFAAAESSKKWVHLLIFPGFFAPAWALEGAKTEMFAIQYGPGKNTVERLPMPWDSVYLTHWFAFLKQLSDRYGRSPAFRIVAADGPTSVSAEFTLPSTREDVQKWRKLSYTPRRYIEAWQKVLQVYAADFPNQCVSLSVGHGLNINDQGRIDVREHLRTRQAVIDQAMGILGHRFVLQNSDLHAGPKNQHPATSFVIGYSGRIITGLQMKTSAEHGSAEMGAEGDPPLALRRSIDKGMKPNDAGQHINYLEIYEPDVVADQMQAVLRYAGSLFERKQH